MGRAAADADIVIVTSDNPRSENPAEIARGIVAGWPRTTPPEIILDREAAIRHAIYSAGPGDGVLIAGKGHEEFQIIGSERHPFRDVEVSRAAIVSHPNESKTGLLLPTALKSVLTEMSPKFIRSESSI